MTITPDQKARLRALGLYGLLAHLDDLGDAPWLGALLDIEERERRRRSLERRVKTARIGRFKPIADFDWDWPEEIDREAIEELVGLRFIEDAANVVLVGPNGVGKTMLAQNIAHRAVVAGHTVRFVMASAMLNALASQDGARGLNLALRRYCRPALLAIDEVGYLSYDNCHADLLFEVVTRRYELRRPLVFTTNKVFSDWNGVFPNAACVVTLVDRLVHRSEVVSIKGESFRLREARERAEERTRRRRNARK